MAIIVVLLGAIGWFIKKILDSTQTIGKDVAEIKPKVDILWKDKFAPAASPRQLNDNGKRILAESGIQQIVDEKASHLENIVRGLHPASPYDAEQMILKTMVDLPIHCPDVVDRLKGGAFSTGTSIDALLFVGGIYLRNKIFSNLGFNLDDIVEIKKA